MLRRVIAFFLVLACALAPVLPAWGNAGATYPACCCGDACASTCGQRDCAPPPATPRASPVSAAVVVVEQAAPAAKPAARAASAPPFVRSEKIRDRLARAFTPARVAAARVPLFRAHCSFLL